jgi:hypothetical protein
MTEQIIGMHQLEREMAMPLTSIISLSAIVTAFLLFAVVLAWADRQTRGLARDKARSQTGQSKAAIAKAATPETAVHRREAAVH